MNDSRYTDCRFSVLGDSVSTLLGHNPPECAIFYDAERGRESGVLLPADTWWGQVIAALGGKLLVNHSVSGSTVTKLPIYECPNYGCSDERTAALAKDGVAPDVVMVFMGFNDWGWAVPPATFAEAYGLMLRKLRKSYPEAELWCFTLPVGICTAGPDFVFPERIKGVTPAEYNDVIRTVSESFGGRLIDLFGLSAPFDTIEGYHPNAAGMKTISAAVLRAL
jgi:lysophospholipase L1-like esterase